ncbi:MAG: hypothetical protein JW706_02210, partial [Opitutales bacterium]|nr:hypothetical protein [Opitutales bacterium]
DKSSSILLILFIHSISPLPEGVASAILYSHTTPAVQSIADERGRSSLPATGILRNRISQHP